MSVVVCISEVLVGDVLIGAVNRGLSKVKKIQGRLVTVENIDGTIHNVVIDGFVSKFVK